MSDAKCAKCGAPATKKVIWADGRAYQPSCDAHVKAVQAMLTAKNGDMTELAGVQDLSDTIDLVSSHVYPDLERKPGGPDNWVEAAGGLPSYIERIAKHLHYERGFSISRAIATAVNTVKRWARGGTVTKYGTTKRVSAATIAKAQAAVASWTAKKRAGDLALSDSLVVAIDLTDVEDDLAFDLLDLADADIDKTDTMVALIPSQAVASKVAVEGGVPVEDLHVTVTFHGELDDSQFEELKGQIAELAKDWQGGSLMGTIGGLGTFPAEDPEKGSPWFAPVDVPGLNTLHEQVAGVTGNAATNHGYSPHMTLTYAQDGETPPSPVPSTPVDFGSIWVVRGNTEREEFVLGAKDGTDLTRRAILSAGDIDLSKGLMDIQALAERANRVKDPARRTNARQAVLDLAVPKSELTAEKRKDRAKSGQAMKDGSFPIFDETSLKSAIRLARTPEQRKHVLSRARSLGLSRLIPDQWTINLAEAALAVGLLDLASTIPPRNANGKAKDGRRSYDNQGKWKHGFVPVNRAAKEAKAKGSPIAIKRLNRIFGKSKDAPKKGEKAVHVQERGTSEKASDIGFLRNTKFQDTRETKSTSPQTRKEESKQGRTTARARQAWEDIPESYKTVRNGKRYVLATFGGKQIITEWMGGVNESSDDPLRRRKIMRTITAADAASMSTAELRAMLKNPRTPDSVRKTLNKALRTKAAEEKARG